MSKLVVKAVSTAQALCKDALGNGSSGNTERSLRYIAEAVRVLNAVAELQTAKGNVTAEIQAEKNLLAALAAAGEKPDWPKFEMDVETFVRYQEAAWLHDLLVVNQR